MPDSMDARLHMILQVIDDAVGSVPVVVFRHGAEVSPSMPPPGTYARMLLVLLDVSDSDHSAAQRGPSGFTADWVAWAAEKAVLRIVGPLPPPLESVVALGVFMRQGTGSVALVLTEPERASVWHDKLGLDTRMVGLHGDAHSAMVH
jgi:hypothetical protein